jgi:hypothetical protein
MEWNLDKEGEAAGTLQPALEVTGKESRTLIFSLQALLFHKISFSEKSLTLHPGQKTGQVCPRCLHVFHPGTEPILLTAGSYSKGKLLRPP